MNFYSGEKILTLKDINGNKPEIFMITDLRSTGKTTYFIKMETNRFIKRGEKYIYLVRYKYQLDELAEALYKTVQPLFFPDYTFRSRLRSQGLYADIYLNDTEIGYGLALNSYDAIKNKSHLFTDASSMLFDEFQSESNKYVPNELRALQSIHKSIARGANKAVKYLPVYMLSNHITLLNPYFNKFGLTNLHRKTRYFRGAGFVLEQQFNEEAAKLAAQSGFEQAFADTDYSNMSKQGRYLLDDDNFIDKNHKIKGKYFMTLIYKNEEYSVYDEFGQFYVSKNVDKTFPIRYIIGDGYGENVSLISSSPTTVKIMRDQFINGNIIFSDYGAKECTQKALSY